MKERVRLLQQGDEADGPVFYWMSRDQRVNDNWSLVFAQQLALNNKKPLAVVFNLVPEFLEAGIRQYGFMLDGLKEIESGLRELNISFYLTKGEPEIEIPKLLNKLKASVLVSDFDPLKIKRIWKRDVAKKITVPFYEVDAHNIVPCLYVSDKAEFAAYTIRPKIQKVLNEFLTEIPSLKRMKNRGADTDETDWQKVKRSLKVDRSVKEVDWIKPGENAAMDNFHQFLNEKFEKYGELRNDPNAEVISNISPHLHFGHISAQRVATETLKHGGNPESEKAFLEELIIRRELSDNFCYFNKNYDSFEGFHDWAKTTLNDHRKDKREYIYSVEEFENAGTHEDLWNAAQTQLVRTGKMHGYMRMYWAKKILEWSRSPEDALKTAIYLNDKYELDGRDPNGYAGCAWSIGGVHDRAWTERPVYGKIRYMNRNGADRKFDVKSYITKYSSI